MVKHDVFRYLSSAQPLHRVVADVKLDNALIAWPPADVYPPTDYNRTFAEPYFRREVCGGANPEQMST